MDANVRPLADAEAGDVARLEVEARAAVAEQRGGAVHLAESPPVGDWSALVARPDRAAWVAVIDEVPVGYLELEIHGGCAVVRQVYVHPEARQLGFGDSLLAAAIDTARERGCTRLDGTALPGDRETKNLYERAGIKARKIVVSTEL